ncbi:terminase small subunit [Tabrizicola sp. BL-A-41-H6]|uniref:terminase small subunit n=1 Tax=Tabrizicola sp. BL-A-41-H6 TaxID=3421107 RepID=UPI003D677DE1
MATTEKKVADARHEAFVRHYLIHGNASRAYREAGYRDGLGTRQSAHRLLTSAYIQARISEERQKILAALDVKVLNVLDRLKAIAFGDAAAITEYVTGACRYCRGIEHRHQWKTHREFADAMEVYMGKGELHHAVYTPPDDKGGYGYRFSEAPHADCPECDGEGEFRVRFKDTRLMTDDERKFFVGVKQTQHGIEFKFNDQMAALKELAKRLGFYSPADDRETNVIARLILELQSRGEIERMPLRKDPEPTQ